MCFYTRHWPSLVLCSNIHNDVIHSEQKSVLVLNAVAGHGRGPLTDYTLFICGFYYNYFYGYNFFFIFQEDTFKLFISLECKYNKLQFGVRFSSIEVSKQKLRISTHHAMLCTTKRKKKIHPGATLFSKATGF